MTAKIKCRIQSLLSDNLKYLSKSPGNNLGFTLIELLVTVAIIGILAATSVVAYNGYISASKKTTTKSLMQTISLAESEWYADTGSYYVNSESATCDANTISIEELNTTLFEEEDVIPDDLGWGICVASAADGGSFQVFAEKDDGTADEVMCLNRNGSIREGQAECS